MDDKEFWEKCGFYQDEDRASNAVWCYPDGRERTLPQIDLNNLFKYAVPKLKPKTLMIETFVENDIMSFGVCILSERESGGLWSASDKSLAIALRKAIEEVFDGQRR